MGIKNWLKNNFGSKKIEVPHSANKWLDVSLVVYLNKKNTKKEAKDLAEGMANIILNTKAVFSKDGTFQGCINPHLGINALMTYDGGKEWNLREITRPFIPVVESFNKASRKWKVTLAPLKENGQLNLYSIYNLYYDMFILAQAMQWVLEKYNIEVLKHHSTGGGSMSTVFIDGKPAIEQHDGIMLYKYFIQDRLASSQASSDIDKELFREDVHFYIKSIKEQNKKIKNKKAEKWLNEVDKILSKYKG